MGRLANIKPKQAIRAFERVGFVQRNQTGSHLILKNYTTGVVLSIPVHPKDIKVGLLRKQINNAGLSVNEFLELL